MNLDTLTKHVFHLKIAKQNNFPSLPECDTVTVIVINSVPKPDSKILWPPISPWYLDVPGS